MKKKYPQCKMIVRTQKCMYERIFEQEKKLGKEDCNKTAMQIARNCITYAQKGSGIWISSDTFIPWHNIIEIKILEI